MKSFRRCCDRSRTPARHPGAFHGGYRLVAFDGTRFNPRNTLAINAEAIKNRCSKGSGVPAFAQLLGVVLVELGLHQPLAAAFGWQSEGELTLARKILARQPLPDRCLILADQLFGIPSLMWELMPMLGKSASAMLFRVKSNLKVTRVRQLGDGSWLVSIPVIKPGTRLKVGTILLREIHAEIHYEGGAKPLAMRLWTSLLDEKEHPAAALVELCASRWEEARQKACAIGWAHSPAASSLQTTTIPQIASSPPPPAPTNSPSSLVIGSSSPRLI